VHPFILITWADTMRNVFTLAHELGHGGHFGLAMKHQRYVNMRPAMPFVEAPSIMNEMLLARHVLARSGDPRMRRDGHHAGAGHLPPQLRHPPAGGRAAAPRLCAGRGRPGRHRALLNQCKGDILSGFWGDTLEVDDGARMTWMRQPHYYMGLYPYTYSVGLVAATAMAGQVAAGGPCGANAGSRC
jgi:oligoendopeptidase F